jgi:hypothetical protein
MKITGPNGTGAAGGPRGVRPGAGGGGFRLPGADDVSGPSQASGAAGVRGVMGVDALLALQEVGGPLERRRKAVGRAGRILDVLDGIKLALLDGELGAGELDRLQRAVRDERALTDDPRLEGVLDEIELRAAVEIAKLERAAHAA